MCTYFKWTVSILSTSVTRDSYHFAYTLPLDSFLWLCFLLGLSLYATLYCKIKLSSLNSFCMKLYILILFFKIWRGAGSGSHCTNLTTWKQLMENDKESTYLKIIIKKIPKVIYFPLFLPSLQIRTMVVRDCACYCSVKFLSSVPGIPLCPVMIPQSADFITSHEEQL